MWVTAVIVRALMLIAVLTLVGCASAPAGPKFVAPGPLAEGLSRIYVFRPHFPDQAFHADEPVLGLNGAQIAAFPVGTYLELDVKPGRHAFQLLPKPSGRSHWNADFDVDVKPGETRYVAFWVDTTVDRGIGRTIAVGLLLGPAGMFDQSNFTSPKGLRLDSMSAADAEPMLRQCHPAVGPRT